MDSFRDYYGSSFPDSRDSFSDSSWVSFGDSFRSWSQEDCLRNLKLFFWFLHWCSSGRFISRFLKAFHLGIIQKFLQDISDTPFKIHPHFTSGFLHGLYSCFLQEFLLQFFMISFRGYARDFFWQSFQEFSWGFFRDSAGIFRRISFRNPSRIASTNLSWIAPMNPSDILY